MASSTTERVLEYGALKQAMPLAAADSRAIWFVPMQKAPMALRVEGMRARTLSVTLVRDRMPRSSTPSSADTSSSSPSAPARVSTS